MKAVSAAKAAKKNGEAAPPPRPAANNAPQVDCADPMLQGTYVSQDEIGVSGADLDDFESRLEHGGEVRAPQHHRPAAVVNKAKVPAAKPAPHGVVQPASHGAAGGAKKPSTVAVLTEEEEERLQDIKDVRDLALKDDGSSSDDD